MTKLELIDKKIELRNLGMSMIETAEKESRELDKLETEKFEEIRNQISNLNNDILNADKELETEKRNLLKNNKQIHMNKNFSVVNAIRCKLNGVAFDKETADVINETSNEMRNAGLNINGITIPAFELRASGSELQATLDDEHGQKTINDDYRGLLYPLYQDDILSNFTWMTGLRGNVKIARYTGLNKSKWEAELTNAEENTAKFDAITATPKRLCTTITISKQLLLQSSEDVESIVRTDIVNSIRQKLQETLFSATAATTTVPGGIFVDASALTNLDYDTLTKVEEDVEAANFKGVTKYIINPTIKQVLRTTLMTTGVGTPSGYLFNNNEVLGQPTIVSNAIDGMVYGDLASIVIAQWGAIDLQVENLPLQDAIRITANAYFDIINRQPYDGKKKTVAKTLKCYTYTPA